MTTGRKITKKRLTPIAEGFPFVSDISGLMADSDEDTTRKQEQDVAGPQKLILEDKTVDHLGSITQPHDTNNIFVSGYSLPSAAVSKLSEQQLKLDEPKDTRGSKVNKRKELKIDLTKMKMTVLLSPDKDELVVSQRMRSSTSQTKGRAGPAKNVLQSSEDSFHIISDSEEEVIETHSNNNARAQRTGKEKGMLPAKNGQQSAFNAYDTQMNTLTSVYQHVATSTPLRKTAALIFTSSLPSPVTPAMSVSTVKTRGRVSPVAESKKMIVLAQKDLNDAAVVPGIHREIEEKDNDHPKRRRTSSRKIHIADYNEASGDDESISIFSTEKHTEVGSGSLEHLHGRSPNRILSAQKDLNDAAVVPSIHKEIEEKDNDHSKRRRTFSRKLYTHKVDEEVVHQEGTVMFAAEKDSEVKCGLSANVRGKSSNRFKTTTTSKSRHYSRKPSGVEESAQDIANDTNSVKSHNSEIVHLNKRATMSQQEEKTCDMEHSDKTADANADLRRSQRQRVKPLEYWRGERIKYKIGADKCLEVAGIDPGLPSRQWVRRERHVLNAKKILQCVEEDSKEPKSRKLVLVPHGNGMRELECFSTFRNDSDVAKCMEGNCVVYTALKVPGMATGYVEIGPVSESCSVIDSNLLFYIVVGELTVTIHETAMKVRSGEMFFVPKGVSHLLRNDGEEKSVLMFTKFDD